jgi:hypothetical protein
MPLHSLKRLVLLFGVLFTLGAVGRVYADPPTGWGGGGKGYELSVDKSVKKAGEASGAIKAGDIEADSFGTLTQAFRADDYRGKRIRMTAYVKAADVEGWSGLWLRIDGKEKTGLAFDNMGDRQIKGTKDWQKYEVVLDVPAEAEEIYFGILLAGKGQVWVDDFAFETVGNEVKTTGAPAQSMDRMHELVKDLPQKPKNLDFEQ